MPTHIDTRAKIVPASGAAPAGDAEFVLLYLDPLTQAHAARLEQLSAAAGGRPMVAVLLNPDAALLPERARAELAASLACVDQVITGAGEAWIAELPPSRVTDERSADLARRDALMRHVASRHALA